MFAWRLQVPNFEVRANATLLFTEAFPVHDSDLSNENVDMNIQKQLDSAMVGIILRNQDGVQFLCPNQFFHPLFFLHYFLWFLQISYMKPDKCRHIFLRKTTELFILLRMIENARELWTLVLRKEKYDVHIWKMRERWDFQPCFIASAENDHSRGWANFHTNLNICLPQALLHDPHPTVRSSATLGVCKILAKCWELLPPTIITDFLKKLVMELATDSSSPDVRCSVFKVECMALVHLKSIHNRKILEITFWGLFFPKYIQVFMAFRVSQA